MKRYIIDSGIAGDYMNRRHGVYERAKAEQKRGNKIGMGEHDPDQQCFLFARRT